MASPQWSTVVKKGRKDGSRIGARQLPSRSLQAQPKRDQKKTGIIGTGSVSNIQAVKTKLVNVFATRFSRDLDTDTLRNYLSDKLGNASVTCRKIDSASNRFSSFHISAECNEVAEMYDPLLWPAGTYVRRYYVARGTSTPAFSQAGVDLPQQHSVSGGTPAAMQECSSQAE